MSGPQIRSLQEVATSAIILRQAAAECTEALREFSCEVELMLDDNPYVFEAEQ